MSDSADYVTRLLCGGFIFALRFNHTMCDAAGLMQFLMALAEIARGASTPSTLPVWKRDFLFARNPPRVRCTHHEYDEVANKNGTVIPLDDMVHRSFFFGPAEISALRRFVPIHLQSCITFELLTACLWRCRTIALELSNPEEVMRVMCVVNVRNKFNPSLPEGYYGNVLAQATAISTAKDLCNKPLDHALELVMKVKSNVTEEYMRSVIDLLVTRGRPSFTVVGSYMVSDVTRARLNEVDLGWGKAIYAGPSTAGAGGFLGSSFYISFMNSKGESGIVVPIYLTGFAMEKFVTELNKMLIEDTNDDILEQHKLYGLSKL